MSHDKNKKYYLPESGISSYALAYLPGIGWYSKSECCQSITSFPLTSTKTIYYYIPNVNGLSLNKKLSYIKELMILFPNRLEIIGIENGKQFTVPGTDKIVKLGGVHLEANGEIKNFPIPFIKVDKWIVVKASVESAAQYLYFLQFLRPLYQSISLGLNHVPFKGSSMEYYQPRLYFKLKKMFPKLTQLQLMYLSFTIHGQQISGVFFPFFFYVYGYKKIPLVIPTETSRINNSVGDGDRLLIKKEALLTSDFLKFSDSIFTNNQSYEFKTKIFRQDEYSLGYNHVTYLLKNLIFCESVDNYKEAIRIISLMTDDPTLIENIN